MATSTWPTPRARERGVQTKAMTVMWPTPRARAQGGQTKAMTKNVKGGRRRAASDTNSSTSSSRNRTSVRDTMEKRRRQSKRQDNEMDRHGHWSISGLAGTGAQRAGAREAAPRYDDTWTQEQESGIERGDDGDADTDANADGDAED